MALPDVKKPVLPSKQERCDLPFTSIPAEGASGAALGLSACLHVIAVLLLSWLPAAPVKEGPGTFFVIPAAALRQAAAAYNLEAEVKPKKAPEWIAPSDVPPAELSRSETPADTGITDGEHASQQVAPTVLPEDSETRLSAGSTSPVEILERPSPTYTGEALALGVEGDVVLEVLFEASGELRVLSIIRGLGHGLDEAAVRAAERMLFWPARREGLAVDCKAIIRIPFRLP